METIPEQDSTTTTTKKSISWAPICSVTQVKHINDFSKDEVDNIWYNKGDYKGFQRDTKITARFLRGCTQAEKVEYFKKSVFSERGIENKISREIYDIRYKRKRIATNTVLEEQNDQRRFGTFSWEFLAQLYIEVSAPCQWEAHLKGLKDERDARACHDEVTGSEAEFDQRQQLVKASKSIEPFVSSHYASQRNGSRVVPREINTRCLISPVA